jgi:plasmid stabilization system protein ParE
VARVELSAAALEDLDALIASHELPSDALPRVVRSLRPLDRFPLAGRALTGRWRGFRFIVGPWRWMLLVYVYIEAEDRVVVVTVQDARTSSSATTTEAARR